MIDHRAVRLGLVHSAQRPAAIPLRNIIKSGTILPVGAFDYHAAMDLADDPLGNDAHGDCVPAGLFRLAQMRMANAWKSTWLPAAAQALALYTTLTGFDPAKPETDSGTDVTTAMRHWGRVGLNLGLQAAEVCWPHISVNQKSLTDLAFAIKWFGGVGISFALPISAQNQPVWDVPASGVDTPTGRPGSWGMHFAPAGRIALDGTFYIITWGAEQPVTQAFMLAYAVAADTGVSRDWLNTAGLSPPGLDMAQLDLAAAKLAVLK